ncbi:MAG TPA: peptide ABC transporter substrate-binding protein [Gemmatimonadaceae bacterium]|nr:peptide ABC transporter substrate-binding protein [Gemmatimonadaceae bacterium]
MRAEPDSGGTLVISTIADPGSLFPPSISTAPAKQITEQIYDHLADVGPGMNTRGDTDFMRQLARDWRWSDDSLSIAFALEPGARWHDGERVTARDVRFTFGLYRNPAVGGGTRNDLAHIDSVTAPDSLTAVFWFKRRYPTQFLDAAAQMLILPAHLLEKIPPDSLRELAPRPIGSGRFRLRKWDKGSSVELVADSANYRGRPRLDRVIWTIAPEFTGAVTKLFSGDADLFEPLRPENIDELSRHPNLRIATLPGLDYAFLQFNLRDPTLHERPHPLFAERNLRRAITMAIDRGLLVRSLFDTLAVVPNGPTVRAYPTTDASLRQIPFDPARANALLDSLGWLRSGAGGTRMRGGRELAFSVLTPSSSTTRVRMAVLLQEQLRRAGIRVSIDQLDFPAFMGAWGGRNFDAALGSWNMGSTPGATSRSWSSVGIGKNGTNFGSYSNPVFDAQLDSALSAGDPPAAREMFTRAYTTINEDAPAIWLYEPKTVIGIHRRIRTTPMRPGGWWTDLASWWIPAAERVGRDQFPAPR